MLALPLRESLNLSELTSLAVWPCSPASKIVLLILPLRELGDLDLPILGI